MPRSDLAAFLSVLVVDDDPSLRRRIGELVTESLPCAFVGHACSGQECLARLAERIWDVVLLDVRMPGMHGVETLEAMRAAGFGVPVVMLSGLPADQYERAAVRAGASAYIIKERAPEDLVTTILAVLEGRPMTNAASQPPLFPSLGRPENEALPAVDADPALRQLVDLPTSHTRGGVDR